MNIAPHDEYWHIQRADDLRPRTQTKPPIWLETAVIGFGMLDITGISGLTATSASASMVNRDPPIAFDDLDAISRLNWIS